MISNTPGTVYGWKINLTSTKNNANAAKLPTAPVANTISVFYPTIHPTTSPKPNPFLKPKTNSKPSTTKLRNKDKNCTEKCKNAKTPF